MKGDNMKKFIIVALAVMLMAAPAFAISVKSVTNDFATGTSADHEQVLAKVYNNTGAALAKGDVLVWDPTNDDGRSVTKCNGIGQVVAGVANEAIAASTWGDMLVYGYHSAVKVYGAAGVNITVGYPLVAYGTTNGIAETTNTRNGYAGYGVSPLATVYTGEKFGTALDTYTSAGTASTVEAFINCL